MAFAAHLQRGERPRRRQRGAIEPILEQQIPRIRFSWRQLTRHVPWNSGGDKEHVHFVATLIGCHIQQSLTTQESYARRQCFWYDERRSRPIVPAIQISALID